VVSSNAFHAENAHNRFKMGPITKKNVVIPNPPSTSRHLHSSTVVNIVARTIICRHYWPTYAGPFVMNSHEQISEAVMDYSQGRNGFERAPGWRSEIALRWRI